MLLKRVCVHEGSKTSSKKGRSSTSTRM